MWRVGQQVIRLDGGQPLTLAHQDAWILVAVLFTDSAHEPPSPTLPLDGERGFDFGPLPLDGGG